MESLSSASTRTWTIPTELSKDEYNELLNEIIQDYGKESDVGEGVDVNGAKEQGATRVAAATENHSNWLAIWGPELLDVARYNEIDVVRAILQAAVMLDTNATASQEPNDDTLLSNVLHYSHDATTGNTALHMAAANGHTAILDLLLTVEYNQLLTPRLQVAEAAVLSFSSPPTFLFAQTNHVGNTALHWAAANGQADAVQLLLEWNAPSSSLSLPDVKMTSASSTATPPLWTVDVLQKNDQGRSILTEGFASNDARVMELLLSHDSASEERLISTTDNSTNGTVRIVDNDDNDKTNNVNTNDDSKAEKDEATSEKADPSRSSVTHTFVFGPRPELQSEETGQNDESLNVASTGTGVTASTIQIREWAMATSNEQSILGQDDPSHDTTGWSVWASSLICAQWMAHNVVPSIVNGKNTANGEANSNSTESSSTPTTPSIVLELGAGCGVPGLTLARALMEQQQRYKVFLTDFNPATVENLQYNIDLNIKGTGNVYSNVSVESVCMNWKDPSTWPKEALGSNGGVDLLIGSDLIYQTDMVPLLMQTITALRPRRFCYVAHTQRNGHAELLQALAESALFESDDAQRQWRRQPVPASYLANPLQSLDDDECFVHFHELVTASMSSNDTEDGFFLYNFVRRT